MVIQTTTSRPLSAKPGRGVAGFSLVELMVVVVVIAIMAALLLPALAKTKEHARSAGCRSNMKQLTLALLMYAEDNEETLPWPGAVGRAVANPAFYGADWCVTPPEMPTLEFSAESADLPGFGHNAECGSIFPYVTSQPRRDYDANFKLTTSVYRCPSSGNLGAALRVNYSLNAWLEPGTTRPNTSPVPPNGVTTSSVSDPSRKILLVNEDPRGMRSAAFAPQSRDRDVLAHLDKANIGFMDGHLESISKKMFTDMRKPRDVDIYFNAVK